MAADSLELELHGTVSCHVGVENQTLVLRRAASALKCSAISLVPLAFNFYVVVYVIDGGFHNDWSSAKSASL